MAAGKALFLDRDGVINIDHGYVGRVEDFELVDGILEFILKGQSKGYIPVIVTNQSGIGRGYYSVDDFEKVTEKMVSMMRDAGIDIDRSHVFYCPHTREEGCRCRKPMPGMFFDAAERFGIDLENSWMIGDKSTDIEAARAAGIKNAILVKPNGKIEESMLHGF